jgi:hypothetical protein
VVGPVGFEVTRVGAAPGSDPRGGAVTIAGMSVAGRGAATTSPLRAKMARLRTIASDTKREEKSCDELLFPKARGVII